MTAIVLDHEEPHEKARRRHREQQAEPVPEIKRRPHQKPEQDKRPGRDYELDDAARGTRRAIAGEDLRPTAGVGNSRGQEGQFRAIQDNLADFTEDEFASAGRGSLTCSVRVDADCKAVSKLAHAQATPRSRIKPSMPSFAKRICAKLTNLRSSRLKEVAATIVGVADAGAAWDGNISAAELANCVLGAAKLRTCKEAINCN